MKFKGALELENDTLDETEIETKEEDGEDGEDGKDGKEGEEGEEGEEGYEKNEKNIKTRNLLKSSKRLRSDCGKRINTTLKQVILGAFSFLSAYSIRDFLMHLVGTVAGESEMKKTLILFLYTLGIIMLTIWVVYIWN